MLFCKLFFVFATGHELTHGFDDEGRQYDKNGDLLNWWDNATEIQFLERAHCMIEQYSNFSEPQTNLSINGINTQVSESLLFTHFIHTQHNIFVTGREYCG